MNDISSLTTFFGWCSVINIAFLTFCTIMMTVFRKPVGAIHSKLSGLDLEALDAVYFTFLANYKLVTMIFAIVPYLSLKMMV
jgi:hypothetical protein